MRRVRMKLMAESDNDDNDGLALFREPDDYYQTEKPATTDTVIMKDGRTITLRLIGHSPLWGHLLWNAGRVITGFLQDNAAQYIYNKTVLELGAGAGLPSLACGALGATTVVVTDYPEPELIANLEHNIRHCGLDFNETKVVAAGYLWGQPVESLRAYLAADSDRFDLVILADILFNHSEHAKLVDTLQDTLSKTSKSAALVFFTPYRPWLLEKDLAFFDLARAEGFTVQKILEHTMEKVMFEEDPGDEVLRRTVFGYQLEWPRP